MNNKLLYVSLDDTGGEFPAFPSSNFFTFSIGKTTSEYLFTADPHCKQRNNVLYTNRKIEISKNTVAILTSNPDLREDCFDVPVLFFWDVKSSLRTFTSDKTNFLMHDEKFPLFTLGDIPISSTTAGAIVSCYVIVETLDELVDCVIKNAIPISLTKFHEDLPFFRYETTLEELPALLNELSPKSYYLSTEHVIASRSTLAYFGNPLDYLFSAYTKYFIERENIEMEMIDGVLTEKGRIYVQ